MARQFNHVAVSVTDVAMAMRWYRDVMGMKVLMEPFEMSAENPASAPSETGDSNLQSLVRAVFGAGIGKFLICHMVSANGAGIELFQFIEPKAERRKDNFEYWKTGFYHIAVTEPRIEELAERIASTGGKMRTGVLELAPGSDKKICFCEDPFGNIIEIYSLSYEQFWSTA